MGRKTKGKSSAQQRKIQSQYKLDRKNDKRAKEEEIKSLNTLKKLEYDKAQLRSRIKNCESDLSGHFKGNANIQNKVDTMKQQVSKIDKEIEDEKRKNEKEKKLKKTQKAD